MYYDKQQRHVVLDPKHSVCSIISVDLTVILCFKVFGQFKWRVELYGQGSFWSHCTIRFINSNEGLKHVFNGSKHYFIGSLDFADSVYMWTYTKYDVLDKTWA